MQNVKGQAVLLLIVVMTVALAIGLSVVQRSLVDVSTASKVEQSSRAFSAAEAGIEKALNSSGGINCIDCQTFNDNNSNIKQISKLDQLPLTPAVNARQEALEYPPLAKEEVAQVWLADPKSNLPNCDTGKICYNQSSLDIYWGNSSTDKAAIEVTLVYFDGTDYQSRKWYLDQTARTPENGFEQVSCTGTPPNYRCSKTLTGLPTTGAILIRARLLYNTTSQPFAVQGIGTCGNSCSLPPQAKKIISIGTSGETRRGVQVFQLNTVVPPYFDFAIFSASDINK